MSKLPTIEQVAQTFRRHHAHHRTRPYATVERDLGSETELSKDYAGRVIFELFQNAVDRAEKRIHISVSSRGKRTLLRVANDGVPFRVNPDFDPEQPGQDRLDFHALCSLHTSAKKPSEAIGNKGVGFRSVFTLGPAAAVWSRLQSGDWWGLALTRAGERRRSGEATEAAASRFAQVSGTVDFGPAPDRLAWKYPSFYFPAPVYRRAGELPCNWKPAPSGALASDDDVVTVVEVLVDPDNAEHLLTYLREFARAPLHFVHLRYRGKKALQIHVDGPVEDLPRVRRIVPEVGWRVHAWPRRGVQAHRERRRELARLARLAGHDVQPLVAIAYAAPNADEAAIDSRPLLVGYLPTEATAPFDLQVQADFLLGTARRAVAAGSGTPVERYNAALLELAGELHVATIARSLGLTFDDVDPEVRADPKLDKEEDLFRLLLPRQSAASQLQGAVERALGLGNGGSEACWRRWAQIAAAWFGTSERPRLRSTASYRRFWEATDAWIRLVAFRGYSRLPVPNVRKAAVARVLAALRRADAAVIPAVEDEEGHATAALALPRPHALGQGRPDHRVLVRRPGTAGADAPYPEMLRRARRLVTIFELPYLIREHGPATTGLSDWRAWDLLAELRQPASPGEDERSAEQATAEQWELLRFALALWKREPARGEPLCAQRQYRRFLWRLEPGEANAAAGRSLCTIWLPLCDGQWLPACQVILPDENGQTPWLDLGALPQTVGVLDLSAFRTQFGDEDVEAFATFLGTSRFLPVREGREDGAALRARQPPALQRTPVHPGSPKARWLLLPSALTQSTPSLAEPVADAVLTRVGADGIEALRFAEGSGAALYAEFIGDPWYPCIQRDADPRFTAAGMPVARAPSTSGLVSPIAVVQIGRGGLRADVLPSVSRVDDAATRSVLVALGIGTITDDTSPDKLRGLIDALSRWNDGCPPSLEAPGRQAFRELFGGLLNRLLSSRDPAWLADLPLLVAQPDLLPDSVGKTAILSRPWHWVARGEASLDGVVALCRARADLRCVESVFRDRPVLVVDTDRAADLAHPRTGALAQLRAVVQPDPTAGEAIEPASGLAKGLLTKLAPCLLALAEVERNTHEDVDARLAAERWSLTNVQRVEDTWLSHTLELGSQQFTETEREGAFGDVFSIRAQKDDASSWLLFDVENREDTAALPPLERFGRGMAEVLLNHAGLTPHLEQALIFASIDRNGELAAHKPAPETTIPGPYLTAFLERRGALAHVDRMQKNFQPLSNDEQRRLDEVVCRTLAGHGLTLSRPTRFILPEDLLWEAPQPFIDQATLQSALRAACQEAGLARWTPEVRFRHAHSRAWTLWLRRRRQRLVSWLAWWTRTRGIPDLSRYQSKLDSALAREPGPEGDHLTFSPSAAALRCLADTIEEAPGLDMDALDSWRPPVKVGAAQRILEYDAAGWSAGSFTARRPTTSTRAPPTDDETSAQNSLLLNIGQSGEQAVLDLAVEKTLSALNSDPEKGWATLESVLKGRHGRELLQSAQDAWRADDGGEEVVNRLRAALQVSNYWWGAGYDILLLDLDPEIALARWEVKCVAAAGTVDLYLSENERAVCRSLLSNGERWHLIAVMRNESESQAVDVTGVFRGVLMEEFQPNPLAQLREEGAAPDGLVLRLRVGSLLSKPDSESGSEHRSPS